jgi:hypothetical protein
VRLGANNEVARDVLVKALRLNRPNRRETWSLRFDPPTKIYGMLFRTAEQEVVLPGRGLVLQPMKWLQ